MAAIDVYKRQVLMGMDLPIAAIRQQIASGIELIVHLGRLPDKSRRVLEITEVCGVENGEIQISPIYPVSYTHLDVYKRQPLGQRRISCINL